MAIIKHKHVRFILEAFQKRSIEANNLVGLQQTGKIVNCLSKGREVVLKACLLTSVIRDQIKEGKSVAWIVLQLRMAKIWPTL